MIAKRAVKVTWFDAESTSEWTAVSDLQEAGETYTLGYLVKETERSYFISSSYGGTHTDEPWVGDTIEIPKATVKELIDIKDGIQKKTPRRIKPS